MQDLTKEWQVEAQGITYEADFEELKQWISEGAVLPSDRVRRGGLRWLTVDRVPELQDLLSPYQIGASIVVVPTLAEELAALQIPDDKPQTETEVPHVLASEQFEEPALYSSCFFHKELDTAFICDVCEHSFCKGCPKSFGGGVKLCPLCDALCRAVTEHENKYRSIGALAKPYSKVEEVAKGPALHRTAAHFIKRYVLLVLRRLPSFGRRTAATGK
jgi:hypothetical protein